MSQLMNESMNDEGVCRRAPATLGLLKITKYYIGREERIQTFKPFFCIGNKIKPSLSNSGNFWKKLRVHENVRDKYDLLLNDNSRVIAFSSS